MTDDKPSQVSDGKRTTSRRRVLRASGVLVASGSILGTASAQSADRQIETLRGTQHEPLTVEEIQDARATTLDGFRTQGGELGEYGVKKIETDREEEIVAYNLVIGPDGRVAENFVDVVPDPDEDDWFAHSFDASTAEQRADALLAETIDRQETAEKRAHQTLPTPEGADFDFEELRRASGSGSDVSIWSEQPPYGNVKRIHEVRLMPGDDQYAVRAQARMNSGHNLCGNRGRDEYCVSGDERRNRSCEIAVDWGSGSNISGGDVAPRNEIEDGTRVTFGGEVTNDSIGASYSYEESANRLVDTSDTSTGIAAHKISLRPRTKAGRSVAHFESYSAGRRSGTCRCGKDVVEITVDPSWARPIRPLRTWPYWGSSGGSTVTDTLEHYCGRYNC